MAPITRSSVHGRSAAQQSLTRQDPVSDEDSDGTNEELMDDNSQKIQESENSSPFRSAQDMLIPLQETANRVSRQVEDFAKSLDKFKSEYKIKDQELWSEAVVLLKKYADHTNVRAKNTATKGRSGEQDQQISALKLEANLWILVANLLLCKGPEANNFAEERLSTNIKKLDRYSTSRELWEEFLNCDLVAQEYETVLDWLQEAATQNSSPLEDVVKHLIIKSDRGEGIWSAGLIYTKDAIKKQKRSRAWPMPLDPSNPGLRSTHVRENDNQHLVTQMDPDAPTREDAKLVKLDEYHEEAAWRVCWEMLRRGMRPNEVQEWWSDRKESWRTALLQGFSAQTDQLIDSPWLRIINMASNSLYLEQCRKMSTKELNRTAYEEAVYGVLSGNHPASMAGCEGMEDALFSYFNAVLIERWKLFIAAHRRVTDNPEAGYFKPAASTISVIRKFLSAAQVHDETRDELHQPLRFIEASIIGQDFEEFFIQQGHSAAQIAHLTGQSKHLMEKDQSNTINECAQIAAQDQDAVRFIAHLQLLLRNLGFLDKAYADHPYQMDNNIVNYIGFLERDAKYNLLPLYASKLLAKRIPHVLGTILIKITDPQERVTQIRLMKTYDIDVSSVLYGIFQLTNYHDLQRLDKLVDAKQAAKVTHYIETGNVKAIKIKTAFMGDDITSFEDKAIFSVEWMRYISPANWDLAILAVTNLYKFFLLTGKLAAARELTRRARLNDISHDATGMKLGVSYGMDDGSEDGDVDMEASIESIEDRVQPVSPTRRRFMLNSQGNHSLTKDTTNREELASASRVWAQLEQLIEALWALERWQDFADEIEEYVFPHRLFKEANISSIRGNLAHMRTAKRELQSAFTELQTTMMPILDPDFLTLPLDDVEKSHLDLIRNHYIPEIILGYNSALYFAGHALTRQYLVECMNLAQEVAQNEMLTNAFVESGRMRELVTQFALDSQALLRANEVGGAPSKAKKGKRDSANIEGKADIWQVTWRDGKVDDLDMDD